VIDVTTNWWPAIVIAAVCGAIGGLVYDLILDRLGDSGLLEGFGRFKDTSGSRSYFDVGFVASVLVGGVAAVAFLFFMPPDVRTVVVKAADTPDVTTVIREYNPFRLIAGTLIVGTGGASFVKAMRERLLKLVNATKLDLLSKTTLDVIEKSKAVVAQAPPQEGVTPSSADEANQAIGRLDALADLARNSRPQD
jgi:hypothetical protein